MVDYASINSLSEKLIVLHTKINIQLPIIEEDEDLQYIDIFNLLEQGSPKWPSAEKIMNERIINLEWLDLALCNFMVKKQVNDKIILDDYYIKYSMIKYDEEDSDDEFEVLIKK